MEIIKNTELTFKQLKSLISSIDETDFIKPLNILNNSTIGQHIRHIIEFYVEFDSGYSTGIVSYDNRQRNLDFETNQALVLSKIDSIFSDFSIYDIDKSIIVKSNHGTDDSDFSESKSSVRRELVYALDHTVHHLAIIKIAMQVEFKHIPLEQNMGVAPSTIRNQNKVCAQ